MLRRLRMPFALAVLGLSALGLAGCSSSDSTPTATTAAPTSAATETPSNEATVNVDLKEFTVTLDPASVAAGAVKFEAKNSGLIDHEMVVVKTDLDAKALPVVDGKVDVAAVNVVARIDPFAAGETKDTTATLEAGKYVVFCDIPGHYAGGMTTSLTVN